MGISAYIVDVGQINPSVDMRQYMKYLVILILIILLLVFHSQISDLVIRLINDFFLFCYNVAGFVDKLIFGVNT